MSVAKFRQTLPAAEEELVICPPNCTEVHDEKWYGVTAPRPKVVDAPVPTPLLVSIPSAPRPVIEFRDPYPSLPMKEWRAAMLRDGASCYVHHDYECTGELVELRDLPPPTKKSLAKHARQWGNKREALVAVQEVADMYGIQLDIPRDALKPKSKPRRPSRLERAQQLVDIGHPWEVVEDELNLSRPQSIELKAEILGVNAA